MLRTALVGHLNLSAVFTHRVFKSELIGINELMGKWLQVAWYRKPRVLLKN
jgi:hypothetical protein